MTNDQIKHMVQRFLAWKLPDPFRPDNGISFTPPFAVEPMRSRHWPTGTNVFDATQAEAMVRHMVADMISPAQGTSAFGQDPKGLEAKPAGPVRQDAPHPNQDTHHE